MMEASQSDSSFWGHLDVLRHVLLKIVAVVCVLAVVAFCFKEQMFDLVLAPKEPSFVSYRLLGGGDFHVDLVNIRLASQFAIHMRVSCYAGVLLASPYIIYQLFSFVSPALYASERRYVLCGTLWGYLLFLLGVLLNYFILFPLAFRFLSTYQVDAAVVNTIALSSYVDTLMSLSLMMGVMFELPLLCWLLAKMGVLKSSSMRVYRRHAVVLILSLAAVITPTSDIFTLIAAALPIYMLYEASILVVRHVRG